MTKSSSTTLDRSVRLLFELAENPEGLTVSELARRLDTQRAPLYRQLRSLMNGRLVRRADNKAYRLGLGVLELARAFSTPLNERVRPVLHDLANKTGYTAHFSAAEGEALVMVASATPDAGGMHVAPRTGYTYPPGELSAPRVAMLASRPPAEGEPEEVSLTRVRGYVSTRTTWARSGLVGVSVPLRVDGMYGALSIVAPNGAGPGSEEEERELAAPLQKAVRGFLGGAV